MVASRDRLLRYSNFVGWIPVPLKATASAHRRGMQWIRALAARSIIVGNRALVALTADHGNRDLVAAQGGDRPRRVVKQGQRLAVRAPRGSLEGLIETL